MANEEIEDEIRIGPGRPRKEFNIDDLFRLAGMMATQPEVARWFGVSLATVENRLAEDEYRRIWDAGQAEGLIALRRTQFQLAEKNATMAIFLGKQYLGQRDIVETKFEVDIGSRERILARLENSLKIYRRTQGDDVPDDSGTRSLP